MHNVLQPLRDAMNEPIKIGSGYRCTRLNQAVGGVANSQHTKGEAVDLCIDGDKKKGRKWMTWIMDHCDFDQLIWEHNKGTYWVHVSFRSDGKNRRHVISDLLKRNKNSVIIFVCYSEYNSVIKVNSFLLFSVQRCSLVS